MRTARERRLRLDQARPIYSDRGSFFELRAASMTQSAMTASQAAQNSHTLL